MKKTIISLALAISLFSSTIAMAATTPKTTVTTTTKPATTKKTYANSTQKKAVVALYKKYGWDVSKSNFELSMMAIPTAKDSQVLKDYQKFSKEVGLSGKVTKQIFAASKIYKIKNADISFRITFYSVFDANKLVGAFIQLTTPTTVGTSATSTAMPLDVTIYSAKTKPADAVKIVRALVKPAVPSASTLTGTVTDINVKADGTGSVTVTPDAASKAPTDPMVLNVGKDTVITKGNLKRLYVLSDIKVGDRIKAEYGPMMTLSIPAQSPAKSIEILEVEVQPTTMTMKGTVSKVSATGNTGTINVKAEPGSDAVFSEVVFKINKDTLISKDNLKRLYVASDIKVGDFVTVTFPPAMTKSSPPQANATTIHITTTAKAPNELMSRGKVTNVSLKDGVGKITISALPPLEGQTALANDTLVLNISKELTVTKSDSFIDFPTSEVKVGDIIVFTYGLAMTNSIPPQVSAKSIHIIVPTNNQPIKMFGRVNSVTPASNGEVRLMVEAPADSISAFGKASVLVTKDTLITKGNLKRVYVPSDIKVGDTVEIEFGPAVAESEPVQIVATTVHIVD